MKHFSKLGVAEVAVEASDFDKGDKLLITGPTTGVMYLNADEILPLLVIKHYQNEKANSIFCCIDFCSGEFKQQCKRTAIQTSPVYQLDGNENRVDYLC